MEKGQVAIFVIIAILLIFGIVFVLIISGRNAKAEVECQTDADCVPKECCHPTSCIAKDKSQGCSIAVCTAECAPETLDCGQASCVCVSGRCGVN